MQAFSQSLNEGISNYYKLSFSPLKPEDGNANPNDLVKVCAPGRFNYFLGAAASATFAVIENVARICFSFLKNVFTLFKKENYAELKQHSFNLVAHIAAVPVGLFGALFPARVNSFLKIPAEGVELPLKFSEYQHIFREFWKTTVVNSQIADLEKEWLAAKDLKDIKKPDEQTVKA